MARVRSLARIKRYHDTVPTRPRSSPSGTASSSGGSLAQVSRARAHQPATALPVPAARGAGHQRRVLLNSHRREIVVVFCDLRNSTPFAEIQRAGGGDGGPEAVSTGPRGPLSTVIQGTLKRFTGDGVMVFFNDPVTCDDPEERALRMALAIRDRVRELADGWRVQGHDLSTRAGVAQRLRDPRQDRLRGTLRLRRDRQRHQPRCPALRGGGTVAGPRHRTRPDRRAPSPGDDGPGGRRPAGLQPPDARLRRSRPRHQRGRGQAIRQGGNRETVSCWPVRDQLPDLPARSSSKGTGSAKRSIDRSAGRGDQVASSAAARRCARRAAGRRSRSPRTRRRPRSARRRPR